MTEVRITTSLTRRDVAWVSLQLLVLHPVSLTLMAAGPLLLAVGVLSSSSAVARLGSTMSWLILLVPAWGLLAATYNAYRPGAAPVYEPAVWAFADSGITVAQPGREARADWDEFTGWRSIGGCLLLHRTPVRYVVIPWRDVSADARAGLEALLSERIGRRRR
jgi:hypothetical protein